jgi:hypothetical protein
MAPTGAVSAGRSDAVLLPSWAAPRRADSVGVIAQAAATRALHGTGPVRLGAQLAASRPRPCGAGCAAFIAASASPRSEGR